MEIRNRTLRSSILLAFAALLLANQILFDLCGGGVAAALARELTQIKQELDTAHRQYMDGVKAGSDATGLYQVYKSLLEEYNAAKAQEPPPEQTVKDPSADDGKLSTFLKSMLAKVNPFSATKTEMSKLEKVLWAIGKAIIPTLAVLLFASMAALPIGWMALGAMAVGGASGGLVNYLFEKRMNQFRPDDKKKSKAEIIRDVTIAGVVDAVMAPINILSAGWAGTMVRGASKQVIMKHALKSGVTYFGGRMVSSTLSGGLKRVWHREVFQDHLKVENMEREVDRILSAHKGPGAPPLSAEEKQVLAGLESEIARLKANDYGWQNLRRDATQALVGAAISGVGGTFLSRLGSGSPLAAKISMKLFKDVKHTDMVANWILSNPTTFATGAANASIQKHFMKTDIEAVERKRDAHPAGSAVHQYYADQVALLEKRRDAIKPLEVGRNAMIDNLLIQSTIVGFTAAKTNVYDLPRERNAKIKENFFKESAEAKEYAAAKARFEELDAQKVGRYQYLKENGNLKGFTAATRDHAEAVKAAREEMLRKEALAANAFETAKKGGSDLYKEIAHRTEVDMKVERRLELARYLGDDEMLEAYKYKARMTPGNETLPAAEIERIARADIGAEYGKKAADMQKQIAKAEEKVREYHELMDQGQEGRGAAGAFAWRKQAAEKSNLDLDQIRAIEYRAGSIPPSTYKTMIVKQRIYEMRANGATNAEVEAASNAIYREADRIVLSAYNDSWMDVVRAEAVANLVKKIPFEDDGRVNLGQKIANIMTRELPKKTQTELINQYRRQLDAEIKANVAPVVKDNIPRLPSDEARHTFLERVKEFFR